MKALYLIAFAVVACCVGSVEAAVTFTGPVTDVDGRLGPQYTGLGTQNVQVRRRPWTPDDYHLVLENYRIHHVTNQKAMDIGVTQLSSTLWQAYKTITVKHYHAYDIWRDGRYSGLHTDFLRIAGQGGKQTNKTDVWLEDLWFHDGDAVPLIIQDGDFGTIMLKDVKIERTTRNVQISTMSVGSIDRIIIEDSPGLVVGIQGRPGTIKEVIIRNSPGAKVSDELTTLGQLSGVKIIWESGSTPTTPSSPPPMTIAPVPEPGALGILPAAASGLLRRRRR